VQSQNLELHLSLWDKLDRFTTLQSTASMPEGYEYALIYATAVRLSPMYGVKSNKGEFIFDEAARLLRNIKAINQTGNHMEIDSALLATNTGSFNILRGF
jgi:hypothetical protein